MSKKKKASESYIYTVTCLYDIPPFYRADLKKNQCDKAVKEYASHGGSRCFGWLSTLRQAKAAVEKNSCDLHEYSYKYAVIEKVADGIHGGFIVPKEWWYEWNGTHEKGGFVSIKKPKELEHTIGWGIG